jgi:hypothetical protein
MPYSEAEARAFLIEARKSFLKDLFTGTELKFKNSAMGTVLGWVTKDCVSIKRSLASIGKEPTKSALTEANAGLHAVGDLSKKLFNGKDITSVVAKVGAATPAGEAICKFLDVMPGLGSVYSGLNALKEFGKAAERAWTKASLAKRQGSVRAGDPRSACVAIGEIIERSRNEHLIKGSVNAAHAATTAGLFLVDGGVFSGPAAGALKSAAQLALRMYLLGRDLDEMDEANEALANPETITADIFRKAPILGCYPMTEGNTFMLVNFLVFEENVGHWMSHVERLRSDIEPIQNEAAELARDATLELKGLATDMWKYRSPGKLKQLKNWWRRKFPKKSKYGPGMANDPD